MKRARRSSLHLLGHRAGQRVGRAPRRPANRRSSRRGRAAPRRGTRAAPRTRASVSPGKPTMNVLRSDELGARRAPGAAMRSRFRSPLAGRFIACSMRGLRVLERHVEVGQHAALGHQRHHARRRAGTDRRSAAAPRRRAFAPARRARWHSSCMRVLTGRPSQKPVRYLDVDAVGAGVLRDHQQLLDAGLEQAPRLAEHLADRPADTRSPRIAGMMQKLQRWLQPSLILR